MWWRLTDDNNDNTNKTTTFRANATASLERLLLLLLLLRWLSLFLIEYVSLWVYLSLWLRFVVFFFDLIELHFLTVARFTYSSHYFAIIVEGSPLYMLQAVICVQNCIIELMLYLFVCLFFFQFSFYNSLS